VGGLGVGKEVGRTRMICLTPSRDIVTEGVCR